MRRPSNSLLVLAVLLCQACFAADSTSSTDNQPTEKPANQPAVSVTNDLTNYQGDRVTFNTDVIVRVQRADGTPGHLYCLPANVRLRGGVGYSASSSDGKAETGSLFRLLKAPSEQMKKGAMGFIGGPQPRERCNSIDIPDEFADTAPGGTTDCTKPDSAITMSRPDGRTASSNESAVSQADPVHVDWCTLSQGIDLRVTKETLERTPPNRYGLTYGLLAVPFKYQLTGAKEFTGSATVGPYIGYRTIDSGRGYGVSGVLFLGYSNISVTQQVNGESKSQNLASIGYGFGVVATIKGSFQLGAVLGFDHVSKDSDYAYNNKPWLAAELGYSFLQ